MNRFRIAATVLVLAAAATPVLADQDRDAKNSIFVEGGGAGLAYSVNYERIFENDIGLRVGFSYLSVSATSGSASANATVWTVPVLANYVGLSSGNHALELGGGATIVGFSGAASAWGYSASGSGPAVLGTVLLGYRRQPPGGGFQFRIGVEALVGKGLALSESNRDPNSLGVLPWGYVSFGFSI
jgi:hypothetical protein